MRKIVLRTSKDGHISLAIRVLDLYLLIFIKILEYFGMQDLLEKKQTADYGSIAQIHSVFMGILWGPCLNITILLVLYSYRKYYIYLHMFFCGSLSLFTFITSIPILLESGVNPDPSQWTRQASSITAHFIIGIISLVLIFLQVGFGVFSRLLNIMGHSSDLIVGTAKAHKILGYLLSILAKANIYVVYGPYHRKFWLYFSQDIFLIGLIIARKAFFPKRQKKITVKQPKNLTKVKSLSQLEKQDYCIFANTIYRLQEAKTNHPAGYKIIQSLVNKSVDAFIYGTQPSQAFPKLNLHSHSFTSLKMLGSPVAKLDIKSVYTCFDDKDMFQANIQGIKLVSQKGNIYQFRLKAVASQLNLRGYEEACQIGRFHSITASKMTRLYTVVSFLSQANILLMQKIFGLSQRSNDQTSSQQYCNPPSQENSQTFIPLLLKVYPNGSFSQKIKEQSDKAYIISHQKGRGLGLNNLQGIKICIITGGTGLFPFCDLIDLLFKQEYLKKQQQYRELIIKISPILQRQQFNHAEIHLFVAVQFINDIHPITWHQLNFLAENSQALRLTLRIKDKGDCKASISSKIRLLQDRFQDTLANQLPSLSVNKIYVCGPPKMNEALFNFFTSNGYDKSLYQFM